MMSLLNNCSICPRECGANRLEGETGYCRSSAGYSIASVCLHNGEEPVISGRHGICNVFFSHCNLQCIYCQNHQISCNTATLKGTISSEDELLRKIIALLENGVEALGFVSPGHFAFQLPDIIQALHKAGYHPATVYNSNGYDKVDTLRSLEGLIDIYLPDMKYFNDDIARQYSDAPHYPMIAQKALKEMYKQKGKMLIVSDSGQALTGLIIRHLVLPGHVDESKQILRWIAEELSPDVHISLMAQYNPTIQVKNHPLLYRKITREEYMEVTDEMESLGFSYGWVQEPESPAHYNPDFTRDHPFEN